MRRRGSRRRAARSAWTRRTSTRSSPWRAAWSASATRRAPCRPRSGRATCDRPIARGARRWRTRCGWRGTRPAAFHEFRVLADELSGADRSARARQGADPLPRPGRLVRTPRRLAARPLRRRPAPRLAQRPMSSMKVGDLREHLAAAMAGAMRRPEPEAVALTADRAKAMAVALAGPRPERRGRPRVARGRHAERGDHPGLSPRARAAADPDRAPARHAASAATIGSRCRTCGRSSRSATGSPAGAASSRDGDLDPGGAIGRAERGGVVRADRPVRRGLRRAVGRLLGVDRPGRPCAWRRSREDGILAHAAIVDRLLYPGDAVLRAGYVEAVAVLPDPAAQRPRHEGDGGDRPHDRRAATSSAPSGTGSHAFYARLGWVTWQGPTWIRDRPGHAGG